MDYSAYIDYALKEGAADCVEFTLDEVCFDSRTLLKCMFGCSDWGRNHTCPSRAGNASLAEYREMLSRYRGGVIIHTHDKALSQRISFEIERRAFIDGYYFAFSMSDCSICRECAAVADTPCRDPKRARPALHSVGIDVFKTVRALGMNISTLSSADDEQNWYSAVFID